MNKILILLIFYSSSLQAKPLVVYLDWFLNPHHAPLVVALQQGFFKQHGLEVELVAAGGSEEGSKQVASGRADIAVSKQSSHLVRVVNQQLPITRIATLIGKPLECLITNKDIKGIDKLKGKRLGFTSSSIEFATYTIKTILEHHNLKLADVTLVPITSNMPTALLAGQVDAIFSAYRTYELSDIRHHQPDVQAYFYEENGIPAYEQEILICHRDQINNPDLKNFVAALEQACQFIKTTPEAAWQLYGAYAREQNTANNKAIFMAIIPYFVSKPSYLHRENYQAFAEFMRQSGLLKGSIPELSQYALDLTAS